MIIGLNGKIGAGKDTVADWLVENHGFRKVGFSDEMYAGVCGLFGIDLETALAWKNPDFGITVGITGLVGEGDLQTKLEYGHFTWREFLQRYGTDMARKMWGEDFWVERFEQKYLAYEKYMPDNQDLVVRDVRFNNEAHMLRKYDGTIWEILRPGYDGDGHESELGIHEGHIDGELTNDGTIEELHEMLGWWLEEVRL